MKSFEIVARVPASCAQVYRAWLDSEGHSKMTGGEAHCSDKVGEAFDAWDGYIQGRNIELVSDSRIVQSWRTAEFPDGSKDSRLEISLTAVPEGCEIRLRHSDIPQEEHDYEQGWWDHYFNPMTEYFKAM